MEVNEKSDSTVGQTQVRQELRFVNGLHFFNGLEFNDDRALDQQINSVSAIECDTFVLHRKGILPGDGESCLLKFVSKAGFVRRFQKTRS